MQQFEFRSFGENAEGPEAVEFDRFRTDSGARAKAGRMAKAIDGPVDLALAGSAPWDERYLTTASPSDYHAAGYRFERLT